MTLDRTAEIASLKASVQRASYVVDARAVAAALLRRLAHAHDGRQPSACS